MDGLLAQLDRESPNWHDESAALGREQAQVLQTLGAFSRRTSGLAVDLAAIDRPVLMVAEPHLGSHTVEAACRPPASGNREPSCTFGGGHNRNSGTSLCGVARLARGTLARDEVAPAAGPLSFPSNTRCGSGR